MVFFEGAMVINVMFNNKILITLIFEIALQFSIKFHFSELHIAENNINLFIRYLELMTELNIYRMHWLHNVHNSISRPKQDDI